MVFFISWSSLHDAFLTFVDYHCLVWWKFAWLEFPKSSYLKNLHLLNKQLANLHRKPWAINISITIINPGPRNKHRTWFSEPVLNFFQKLNCIMYFCCSRRNFIKFGKSFPSTTDGISSIANQKIWFCGSEVHFLRKFPYFPVES